MVSTSIPTLSIAAISSAKAETQYYNTKHGKIATDRGVALLNGPTQPPRDILSHLLACWTGVLTSSLSRAGSELWRRHHCWAAASVSAGVAAGQRRLSAAAGDGGSCPAVLSGKYAVGS